MEGVCVLAQGKKVRVRSEQERHERSITDMLNRTAREETYDGYKIQETKGEETKEGTIIF